MSKGDTKYADIEKTLSAVGKSVFVRFYYDFKDASIAQEALANKLYQENPGSKSKRQGFRIPRARHIFETGQQVAALKIIIDSPRIESKIKKVAIGILASEEKELNAVIDIESEEYLQSVNREVVYNSAVNFEYDNVPKKPKQAKPSVTKKYDRNPLVAKNALIKAQHLCEYDEKHYVFVRKNSDKYYTEPHHLVPLSAAADFPDIDLDREQNIVSLCSNCHNRLHYGADYEEILRPLYEQRRELLKAIGVDITYEELKKYY